MMGVYFKCPNCQSLLEKSPMDAALSKAGGFAIINGSRTVMCPSCGTAIDRVAITSGEYDVKIKKWWQFWKR